MTDVSTETAVEVSSAQGPQQTVVLFGTSQRVAFGAYSGYLAQPRFVNLVILDPIQDRAPTILTVRVVNADPWAEIRFLVAGDLIWTAYADADGSINQMTIDLPGDLGAGIHELAAETDANGTDTENFTLEWDPLPLPLPSVDAPAEAVPDSAGRWIFQDLDPDGLGSWVMPYNPRNMTSPHFMRTVTARHTTSATEGRASASEAYFAGMPWKITGTYLDENYYNHLVQYAAIRRRFYVIDHHERAWKVGVVALRAEPAKYPLWRGEWQMDLVIYDQIPTTPV